MADQGLNYDDPATGSNPTPNPEPAASGSSTRPPSPTGSTWSVNTGLSVRTRGTMPPITDRNHLPAGGRFKYIGPGNAEYDVDPSQFGGTDRRADKKRRFDDASDLRAATVETRKKLAKRYDQLETRVNPAINDRYTPLKEIKPDELEFKMHPNTVQDPSYIHTIDDPQTDINFYSVQNPRTGQIIGKVDLYDRKAMEALMDTLMAHAKRTKNQVGNFSFHTRSVNVDKSTSAYKRIQARNASKAQDPANQEQPCGHCGAKGHALDVCCNPMPPPSKHLKGGSIAGCPYCNTMAHGIDDCSALAKYLFDLTELAQSKCLAMLLCFNRNNRPAIRSEKWFFLDAVLGTRSTWEGKDDNREHHLAEASKWVPWTDPFALQVLRAPFHGPLTSKDTFLPQSIVAYGEKVSDCLPRDPYWADTKVYEMIEYHKAGWYDDLRYFSATTLALAVPQDQLQQVEDIVFLWAKQADIVVERNVAEDVQDHIALPSELPEPKERVVTVGDKSVTIPKEVLLNPGTWVDHDPTGTIFYEKDDDISSTAFLVYKTTASFDALVKKSGALVWRAKRAVNDYRLGRFKPEANKPVKEWMHGVIQFLLDDSQKQLDEERAERAAAAARANPAGADVDMAL